MALPFFVRDIRYYIAEDFNQYHDFKSADDRIVARFKNMFITSSDEKLLNLYFKENPTQEDLDKFLTEWDIEREGGHKALLLAYFMKKHPEFVFPQYVGPRLQGILKFFKYKNLVIMPHFRKICTAIRDKNVDMLVIKGGSFRHRNPDFPRVMGDIDFLVRDKDFKTAVDTALSFGYSYYSFQHSVDICDPKIGFLLDIHRKLSMQTGSDELVSEDFFNRATREKVFSVDGIYVPCPEDMMFILLVNMNKNLAQLTCRLNILYYIADSMYLLDLKPDFDWEIVRQNFIKTKTELQAVTSIKFLNQFVPRKLPEFFVDEFSEKCRLYMSRHPDDENISNGKG